ncbi:hypothetical protein LTR84_003831 [Exophiala bonariae]|uniref:Cell surface protein n=1 Tax=Exophiala bonariae TaxID=1690606 RepID=A0AAV9N952_9EURO|nr:hypothetical protein LTR84_003831 [Exophiala bonariae]
MPSVMNKIKDRMHGGRDNAPYDDEYDQGRYDNTSYGQDQYAGTSSYDNSHLPGQASSTGFGDPSSHHADGHKYVAPHGTHVPQSQQDQYGQTRRPGEVTDPDRLMDPAAPGVGSNVIGGTGVGPAGHNTGLHGSHNTDSNTRSYESGVHSSALPSSDQHHGIGQEHHLGDNVSDPKNRHGHGDNTLDTQSKSHGLHNDSKQHHTTNTTTTTTSSHFPHGHHDTKQTYPDQTASNYQQDHNRHNPAVAAATAAGGAAVGGLAGSQMADRTRHQDDNTRFGTGAHGQQAYDSNHDGRIDQRDHAPGAGSGGVYNTVVGRGSNDGDLAQSNRGADNMNSSSRNYDSHTGTGIGSNPGHSSGVGKTIVREAGDSQLSSGPGSHNLNPGSGAQNVHQGAMARDSNVFSGGSLHSNAKVMHRCVGCGQDNDISHYFKKDLVYRIDHQ